MERSCCSASALPLSCTIYSDLSPVGFHQTPDGTHIPAGARVKQAEVDARLGALRSRLHVQGQVTGPGHHPADRAIRQREPDSEHPAASGAGGPEMSAAADGPELRAAKQLMDLAKSQGFAFQRVAPGTDGPLFARRETLDFRDEIYLGGFSDSCHATRARKYSLIVPGGLPVTARVIGDALTVLHTVVSDWPI
jgi:hypothetical protein